MLRLLLACALACRLLSAAAPVDGPDLAYTKVIQYQIRETSSGYQLSSEITVRRTALTERAARTRSFQVVEQPYTTVSGLRGESRGRELKPEAITFHFPKLEDTFIPPARVHELDFPEDLKAGDAIAYAWKETFKDLAFLPVNLVPAVDRVERFEIHIEHPANLRVEFTSFFPHGDLSFKEERPVPGRTLLTFLNLPRPKRLPSDPYQGLQAAVLTRVFKGDALLTPSEPAAFAAWYLGLLGPQPQPSDAMKGLLAAELAQAATTREKVRILFDYVKSEIRYIADEGAMHAFIPHDPASVLEKKYGDCKDKAWLLTALARIHGLPVYTVLLSTTAVPSFEALNPGLFNHVICAWEESGRLEFMDPTATHSELGDLPEADALAEALLLDPAHPRRVRIPLRQEAATVEVRIEGDLARPKAARAKITLRHGWRAQALRARKELRAMDLENALSNRLNRLLAKLSVDHFRFLEADRDKVLFEADADLTDFFIRTDLRVYAPSAPFRTVSPEGLERGQDPYPLEAQGPGHYRLDLTLNAEGLQPRPERIQLGREAGASHAASCAAGAGKVHLAYTFKQPFRIVPSEARAEFLAFCGQYLQSNRKLFVLQRSEP